MKKYSVVTKTGDDGSTSLFGDGIRVKKNHPRVNCYGEIDELNTIIGLVIAEIKDNSSFIHIKSLLEAIQSHLFEFGSDIAIPSSLYKKKHTSTKIKSFKIFIKFLETQINDLEPKLPALENFILPGGSKESSFLHLARTVCRRVERSIITLLESKEELDENVVIYFNRLSDFFFILSRFINLEKKVPETVWKTKN